MPSSGFFNHFPELHRRHAFILSEQPAEIGWVFQSGFCRYLADGKACLVQQHFRFQHDRFIDPPGRRFVSNGFDGFIQMIGRDVEQRCVVRYAMFAADVGKEQ